MRLWIFFICLIKIPFVCGTCPDGSGSVGGGDCAECSSGKHSDSSTDTCRDCPGGYRQPYTGQSFCLECLVGEYQEGNVCEQCPSGYYQSISASIMCVECPRGYFVNNLASQYCQDCTPGKYQDEPSQSSCIDCLPGQYSSQSASYSCNACPVGFFQDVDIGSGSCIPCEFGNTTFTVGQTECQPCSDGTCSQCVGHGGPGCLECENGKFSVDSNTCTDCPTGYISSALHDSCSACEFGKYVSGGDTCLACPLGWAGHGASIPYSCQMCSGGTYRDISLESCGLCPVGYFSNDAADSCEGCAAGKYADQLGSITCKDCSAGKKSSPAAHICNDQCPNGFENSDAKDCLYCPVGKDGSSFNTCQLCALGYYKEHVWQVCQLCPTGKVSSDERDICNYCEPGTYELNKYCIDCPTGYFMPNVTTVEGQSEYIPPQSCIACLPGMFTNDLKSFECTECPAGTYTDLDSAISCKTCPNGWISETPSSIGCEVCPSGYYDFSDPLTGQSAHTVCHKCQAAYMGLICEEGIQSTCEIGQYFKPGNISSTGPDQHASCQPCPIGRYGQVDGSAEPNDIYTCVECSAGKYGDQEGSVSNDCKECPPGYVTNLFGAGSTFCIECSAGEVCQECSAGTYFLVNTCVECEMGKISEAAASVCVSCPPGYVEVNRKKCDQCPEGKSPRGDELNLAITDEVCIDCPAGKFGQNGVCSNCALGQYQENTASASCKYCPDLYTTNIVAAIDAADCMPCPPQFSLVADGICSTCPPGKFTLDSTCQNCGAGTYRTASQEQCQPCAAGKSSVSGFPCQDCSPGFYTDQPGSTLCIPCDGISSASTCSACSAGRFGTPIPSSAACKLCPAGYWSPSDSQECFECDIGTAQPLTAQTSCIDCDPGKFASETGQTTCHDCQMGEYQPSTRAGTCLPCPIGRYQGQTGSEECIKCIAGKYTEQVSSTNIVDCKDCPVGTFEIDGQCSACPERSYQDDTGQTLCKSCPENHLSSRRSTDATQCFPTQGLTSYVFGMKGDSKESQYYDKKCEIRPNLVMLCPGCSCDDDSRNGYWSGPICSECRRGFATTSCTAKCPAYDGTHDSTMCNGNGFCWFGKFGNGLCYCGAKHAIDSTTENVVVDVRLCPKGQICPNYGIEEQTETNYRPLYYIMRYRQYSVFVLQLNKYTPERGHMWFKRFPPSIAYKNTCLACVSTYAQDISTKIGFWNKNGDYEYFGDDQQPVTGFHGENCQYECALCLNGGRCSHVPHPYRYSYTIYDTFQPQKEVFIPQTLCMCSSLVYDPENMCCPHGFQPWVHYGLRLNPEPYTRFSQMPYITSIENKNNRHWINKDIWLETDPKYKTPYYEPYNGLLWVANNNRKWSDATDDFVQVSYKDAGPYNKHVFYGVPKQICRACPGLFGKGVRAAATLVTTEEDAEDYWWDNAMGASPRKCNGIGVCDFYARDNERITDFFGDSSNYEMFERGRSCSAVPIGDLRQYTNIQDCINYAIQVGAPWISFSEPYKGGYEQDMLKDIEGNVIYYNNKLIAEENAKNINSKGFASSTAQGVEFWSVLVPNAVTMPLPNSDSNYTIYPTSSYTCGAYATCDSYVQVSRFNVYKLEFGRGSDRLDGASFDRFDTCFTYTKDNNIQTYGLYVTQDYNQGEDPFLGGLCPKGHFCTVYQDIGYKEACPAGYYQPDQGRTRTVQQHKCSILTNPSQGCQLNQATANPDDYIDNVCIRCPRNYWAPAGSPICTQCPNGKIKKISGVFDVATPILNVPTMNAQGYTPWYYIQNEIGSETSDCAIIPAGIVHIPNLNDYMTYERQNFLSVAACPFGFSSRPGTFIFEGFHDLTSLIISSEHAVIEAPYIQYDKTYQFIETDLGTTCECQNYAPLTIDQCSKALEAIGIRTMLIRPGPSGCFKHSARIGVGYFGTGGREILVPSIKYICRLGQENNDLAGEFVRANCFRCPGNSITGPSSTTCTTCFANQMKVYAKEAIQKIAESATTRLKDNTDDETEYRTELLNFDLTYDNTVTYHVSHTFTHFRTSNDELSLADCYIACQSESVQVPMTLTAVGLSKPVADTCVCSVDAISASLTDSNYIWFTVSGETETLVSGLKVPIVVSKGRYGNMIWSLPSCTQRDEYTFSQCVQECLQADCEYVQFESGSGCCLYTYLDDASMFSNDAFTPDSDILFAQIKMDTTGNDLMKIVPETYTESVNECISITSGTSEKCAQMCEEDLECAASYMYTEYSTTKCCLVPVWHYGTGHKAMTYPTQSTNLVIKNPKFEWKYEPWLDSALPLCAACQPGKFTNNGCQPCEPGLYTETPQQADKLECVECEQGRFASARGSKTCTICPPGKVQPLTRQTSCVRCGAGKYMEQSSQSSCKSCPPGKYSGVGAKTCTVCSPGTYSQAGSSASCDTCETATYQDEAGKTGCIDCPAGYKHFSPTQCQECTEGKYQTGTKQSSCTDCLVGTYSNQRGRTTSCSACAWGKYQSQTGMRFCLDCPGGRSCSISSEGEACTAGRYASPRTFNSNCYACPAEQTSSATRTNCEWCPTGKSTRGSTGTTCRNCPAEGGDGTDSAGVGTQTVPEHTTKKWKTWVVAPTAKTYTFRIRYVDDVTILQFRHQSGGSAGRFRKTYTQSERLIWEMYKGKIASIETTCTNYGGPSRCKWHIDSGLTMYKENPGSAYCAIPDYYRD